MPSPKANILVAFYSRDGSVEALAKAVSEGAREAGAEVRLRRVPEFTPCKTYAPSFAMCVLLGQSGARWGLICPNLWATRARWARWCTKLENRPG